MKFEYDPDKSTAYREKHGIDVDEAQTLWEDPYLIEAPAKDTEEPRFLAVGVIGRRHWSAIYAYRNGRVHQMPQDLPTTTPTAFGLESFADLLPIRDAQRPGPRCGKGAARGDDTGSGRLRGGQGAARGRGNLHSGADHRDTRHPGRNADPGPSLWHGAIADGRVSADIGQKDQPEPPPPAAQALLARGAGAAQTGISRLAGLCAGAGSIAVRARQKTRIPKQSQISTLR